MGTPAGGFAAKLARACASMGFVVVEIEPADVAVLHLGESELEVVAKAEVQREAIGHAPIVVHERAVAVDARVVVAARFDESRRSRESRA